MAEKPLCGFLNLLKPPGMTSSAAVCAVKRLLHGEKIGHGGTLDPEAAGVLPLSIGTATRLFDYLQEKEKAYIAEIAFTGSTDTEDAQGKLLQACQHAPSPQAVINVLPKFRGEIEQKPPMFSALKQDGVRLYQLARNGERMELPARRVTVYELDYVTETSRNGHLLRLKCSKGFYVRSLCRDIGQALGAPAHMRFLLRTQSGMFGIENTFTIEEVQRAARDGSLSSLMLKPEQVLSDMPSLTVPDAFGKAVFNGVPLPWDAVCHLTHGGDYAEKPVMVFFHGELLGIAGKENGFLKMRAWLYR